MIFLLPFVFHQKSGIFQAADEQVASTGYCEIIVKCQLDTDWSVWFEGLTITYDDKGHTIISGQLRDQAAFYGLLAKVRDLCLFLVSVKYMVDESLKANGDSDNNS